ncbi:MAG: hypothetical protein IJ159_03195 [Prevotella sp.]|nr:hypothetical protein [Prevotella sp.]
MNNIVWQLRLVVILSTIHYSLFTFSRSIETINEEKAHEVAREQVIWNDHLCPFSTFALDFLKDIYGKSSYKGLMPEQVVYGWMLRPEIWKDEPMLLIPDADLRRQLSIEGDYAKFSELFDDTLGYKLNTLGSNLPPQMQQLIRESPSVVELDEKVGMIILLTRGELFQRRPDSIPPLSKLRVEAEIIYNSTPVHFIFLFIIILGICIYLTYLFLINRYWKSSMSSDEEKPNF